MKPTLTVACVILKSAWQTVPLRSALAALLLAEIAALGAAEPAVAWPPPHLRALPADYLQHAHASLVEVASQGARLLANEPVSGDSIHWIRYGIASLMQGEHVAEINRFFESAKFVWPANPKFGFGLFSTDAMRLYALMNHRTGVVKGCLSQAAQENLEKQMWQVAKVNSKLAEGSRGALEQEASENHHLTSKVGDFLAAQFIRNIPAFAKAQYDDASTPAQQYAARRYYFLAWFDERARRGLFSEAGSPSYQA